MRGDVSPESEKVVEERRVGKRAVAAMLCAMLCWWLPAFTASVATLSSCCLLFSLWFLAYLAGWFP